MKKYFTLITLILLVLSLNAQQGTLDRLFYYYKGEKNYLEVDYSR